MTDHLVSNALGSFWFSVRKSSHWVSQGKGLRKLYYSVLDGGFKYFLFSFPFGEDFQFDSYFSDGRVQPPPSIAIFVLLLGKHTSFGAGGVGYKQTNSGSYKWSLKSIGPRVDDMCFLICFL